MARRDDVEGAAVGADVVRVEGVGQLEGVEVVKRVAHVLFLRKDKEELVQLELYSFKKQKKTRCGKGDRGWEGAMR